MYTYIHIGLIECNNLLNTHTHNTVLIHRNVNLSNLLNLISAGGVSLGGPYLRNTQYCLCVAVICIYLDICKVSHVVTLLLLLFRLLVLRNTQSYLQLPVRGFETVHKITSSIHKHNMT